MTKLRKGGFKMRFSERYGFRKPKEILPMDQIDRPLKNRLWNVIIDIFKHTDKIKVTGLLMEAIWDEFLHEPKDEIPDISNYFKKKRKLKEIFFTQPFPYQYDFIEFITTVLIQRNYASKKIIDTFNFVLEEEKSPYRFCDTSLVPITNEIELEEIASAQQAPDPVSQHILKAIDLYKDRENPDYANSVKESISAVEAAARLINEKNSETLGQIINDMRKKHLIHNALAESINKLYGWASDTARHGAKPNQSQKDKIDEKEARLALVTCSAIANYLISLNIR